MEWVGQSGMLLRERKLKKLKSEQGDGMTRKYPCVRKAMEIDRRVFGPSGKTKHGKVVRDPYAYVFGGMRRAGWKPKRRG